MKKAKFIFKVNSNNYAKVYVNQKWLKDITKLDLSAMPWKYNVEIEQYKRNKEGDLYVENGKIASQTINYRFGRGDTE